MLSKILSVFKTEPAVVLYSINAALTALVAFGVHASPGQTGAVTTIAAGVITIITAVAARPVVIPTVTGAITTIATAAGAFGLHLTTAQIGAVVPVVSIILALVLRQAVTPVAALNAQNQRPSGAALS